MDNIKIIALDMDDTLLNSRKELSSVNAAALTRAALAGAVIVPSTGRFYTGIPEAVRSLPFIRYAILVNGAAIYDAAKDEILAREELSKERAIEIMEYLDGFDVVYDCYQDGFGFMTKAFMDKIFSYTTNPFYREMVQRLRKPVPELKAYLKERDMGVQKVMLFTSDKELRLRLMEELKRFDDTIVSSSMPENIEINAVSAHKGKALENLAGLLGVSMAETAAFGDGLNDVSMIARAGIGIAMANACDEAKAVADRIVASADEDGVAEGIARLGF